MVKALEAWRRHVHHNHPLDTDKRTYHRVYRSVDGGRMPDAELVRREVEILGGIVDSMSVLVSALPRTEGRWSARVRCLAELRGSLRRLLDTAAEAIPSLLATAKSALDEAEYSFRVNEGEN